MKGNTTGFVLINVRFYIANNFIAGLGVALYGYLIAHGAAGAKQSSFHIKKPCYFFL
jgi:hypothetical protein